jgi:hypothetical protein
LTNFQGVPRAGHGGAINGCVTELAVLPGERLGVVVCANKDSANLLVRRISDAALGQALALIHVPGESVRFVERVYRPLFGKPP